MSEITAVGVFEERRSATSAVEALRQAGFVDDEIGLISRDDKEPEKPANLPVRGGSRGWGRSGG